MADLRVLDITTMFSGAFGATLLGDFGADVIKIELPGSGDPVRAMAPSKDGVSLVWSVLSRNKRTITLDIRKPAGRELLLRLVGTSDLLFENFRPGTLDRYDLSYDTLRAANPRLVVVRVSGYGQNGPHRDKAGFGTPATAFSGLTYMTGYPDRPPVNQPFPLADYATGVFAALAALMAVYHRDTQGADGQEIDLALYESIFRLIESIVPAYDQLGVVAERRGNALGVASPVGTYATRDDGWVVLTASTDRTFLRFCEVTGQPELPADPRFASNELRVQHNAELEPFVAAWFAAHDRDDAIRLLDKAGVPVSPLMSIKDIFADPHYAARGNLVEVDHPTLGTVTMPGIVPRFSSTPGAVRHAGAHDLGAFNADIYGDLLGLDDDDLRQLREDGVI
ncbi:MAG: CoA transferase [Chloroflexota bacterium]|nr:CoA transferase [Chloroflexota bacterium]